MISTAYKNFMRWLAISGMLSLAACALAPLLANTGLDSWYSILREPVLGVSFGTAGMGRPMLVWINQAGMSMVLFLVGLEFKRALMDGELTGPDRLGLPLMAALGGLAVSAALCAGLGWNSRQGVDYWVLPLGIDATLGLAVLAFLGDRVPGVLKAFFTTTAIFTLMCSVLLLSLLQFSMPAWSSVALSGGCLALLFLMNIGNVEAVSLYFLPALTLWGVHSGSVAHAALAGLASAFFIPTHNRGQSRFPLYELEQDLLPVVCCVVAPLMALVNAGARIDGTAWSALPEMQTLGILLAMFPGKAAGMMSMCWVGKRLRISALPPGADWKEIAGAALLGGAGFGVNAFLGVAAFGHDVRVQGVTTLTLLVGSALSMLAGYLFLRQILAGRRNKVLQRS